LQHKWAKTEEAKACIFPSWPIRGRAVGSALLSAPRAN
jgi:hypothetical protein